MLKKLKGKKGETLVESLVAMLIALLSMVLLTTATMTATKLNVKTREMDKKYATELNNAEAYLYQNPGVLKIDLDFDTAEFDKNDIEVEMYGESESVFLTYKYSAGGNPP